MPTALKVTLFVLAGAGVVGAAAALTKGFTQAPKFSVVDEALTKNNIYSVEFKEGEVEGTRLDSAKDLKAGINGETNNFDHVYPWSEMKSVKDSNGDVFVKIPKFYEKIEFTEEGRKISITGAERKGFHVHPAFIQGDKEVDEIQIGAYEASYRENSSGLASVSGKTPAGSKTLDEFRAIAESEGNTLFDWRQNQALQSLFAVEFATLDSQSVMRGGVEYVCTYASAQDEGNERKFSVATDEVLLMEKTNLTDVAKVGANVFVYYNDDETTVLGNRKIEEIKFNAGKTAVTSITLDEALPTEDIEDFDVEKLYFDINGIQKTGLTDGQKGSSVGSKTSSVAMSYRGIENWYGSSYTFVDGIYTIQVEGEDSQTYDMIAISMDSSKNSDRSTYKMFGKAEVTSKVSGQGLYIGDVSETDAEDAFSLAFASEARIGFVGGRYGSGVLAGAFCTYINYGLGDAGCDCGVRLSYIPH